MFFQIYKLFGISCVGCKYGYNPTRFLLLLSSFTYFLLSTFSQRRLEREQLLLHRRPWNWNQITKLSSPPTSYAAGTSPESLCRYVWPPRKSPGDQTQTIEIFCFLIVTVLLFFLVSSLLFFSASKQSREHGEDEKKGKEKVWSIVIIVVEIEENSTRLSQSPR